MWLHHQHSSSTGSVTPPVKNILLELAVFFYRHIYIFNFFFFNPEALFRSPLPFVGPQSNKWQTNFEQALHQSKIFQRDPTSMSRGLSSSSCVSLVVADASFALPSTRPAGASKLPGCCSLKQAKNIPESQRICREASWSTVQTHGISSPKKMSGVSTNCPVPKRSQSKRCLTTALTLLCSAHPQHNGSECSTCRRSMERGQKTQLDTPTGGCHLAGR
jgi:hypothetical protein